MYWMKAKTTRQYSAAFQKVSSLFLAIDPLSFANSASWGTYLISICM